MTSEVIEVLKRAVIGYDSEAALNWAQKAVAAEVAPIKALDALTEGIRYVGDRFGQGVNSGLRIWSVLPRLCRLLCP